MFSRTFSDPSIFVRLTSERVIMAKDKDKKKDKKSKKDKKAKKGGKKEK